jgi:hypothetical protein
VHELYAVTLEPMVSYADFADFLARGILAGEPDNPHHRRIASARRQVGSFPYDQLLAYVPSPLLTGGRLDEAGLAPMPAAAVMTINGDLYTQLAHRRDVSGLQGIEPYEDERGRARLRAVWG